MLSRRLRVVPKSGELSEREAVGMMTREIRLELNGDPYSRVAFFSGAIPYPKGF